MLCSDRDAHAKRHPLMQSFGFVLLWFEALRVQILQYMYMYIHDMYVHVHVHVAIGVISSFLHPQDTRLVLFLNFL